MTDSSGTHSYVYNADGSRLLARDPSGATLYVGSVQLRLTTSTAAKTAQRYYTFNERAVAQRTAAGVQFLTGDPHGTSLIAIDNTATQAVTKRYQDPYGNSVGTAVAWIGTKTFVGGDQDPTGLEHMGAREYDAGLGRFISRDPVFDATDSQQINGYAYANNNPITKSDPSGLMPIIDAYGSTPYIKLSNSVREAKGIRQRRLQQLRATEAAVYRTRAASADVPRETPRFPDSCSTAALPIPGSATELPASVRSPTP
nr:hypothetical protein GCM10020092_078090 [Actinoplanes digitatis]